MKKKLHWTQTEEGKARLRDRFRKKKEIDSAVKHLTGIKAKNEEFETILRDTNLYEVMGFLESEIAERQNVLRMLQALAKRIVEASYGNSSN